MVRALLAVALAVAATTPPRPLGLAEHLLDHDEPFQAALEYHRALFACPGDPGALLGLGEAYLRGGRPDQARRWLAQLPAADERASAARFGLVRAQVLGGDHAGAVAALAAAEGPQAWSLRGRLAAEAGHWDEAGRCFAAAGATDLVAACRTAAAPAGPGRTAVLAAGLVPGGGYLAIGRPGEALGGLGYAAALGVATAYYLGRHEHWLAAGTGALTGVFWAGSMFGAAREAELLQAHASEDGLALVRARALGREACPR